jgi:hypothetical protein
MRRGIGRTDDWDTVVGLAERLLKRKGKEKVEKEIDRKALGEKIIQKYNDHPCRGDYSEIARHYAFIKGRQHEDVVISSEKQREMEELGETLKTENRVTIAMKVSINRLRKMHQVPVAYPLSTDHEDKQAADYMTNLAKFVMMNQRWGIRRKLFSVLTNAYIGKVSFLHYRYDPDYRAPGTYHDGKKVVRKYGAIRGDMRLDVLDRFQVFPDPHATDYYDMRWCIVVDDLPIRKAKALYGDECREDGGLRDQLAMKFQYINRRVELHEEKRCLRLTYYSRPVEGAPKGRKIIIVNGEAKKIEINPLWSLGTDYCMPVIPVFWDKDDNTFEGTSPIPDIIGSQIDINRLTYTMHHSAETTGQNLVLIPDGDTITKMTGDGAKPWMLKYTAGPGSAGPYQLQGTPVPEHFFRLKNDAERYILDRSGVQDVNLGVTPRERVPAAALRQLSDESMTMPNDNLTTLGDAILQSTWVAIGMMKLHFDPGRHLTWSGYDQREKYVTWNEETVGKADVGFSLEITDSALRDPAAMSDIGMMLYREGIFGMRNSANLQERAAAEEALRAVKFGKRDDIDRSIQLQVSHARWQIKAIVEKKVDKTYVPALYIDAEDPVTHFVEFRDYIMTDAFRKLDRAQRDVIAKRLKEYRTQMEQAQGGAPGGAPGAPPIGGGAEMGPPVPEGV